MMMCVKVAYSRVDVSARQTASHLFQPFLSLVFAIASPKLTVEDRDRHGILAVTPQSPSVRDDWCLKSRVVQHMLRILWDAKPHVGSAPSWVDTAAEDTPGYSNHVGKGKPQLGTAAAMVSGISAIAVCWLCREQHDPMLSKQ